MNDGHVRFFLTIQDVCWWKSFVFLLQHLQVEGCSIPHFIISIQQTSTNKSICHCHRSVELQYAVFLIRKFLTLLLAKNHCQLQARPSSAYDIVIPLTAREDETDFFQIFSHLFICFQLPLLMVWIEFESFCDVISCSIIVLTHKKTDFDLLRR